MNLDLELLHQLAEEDPELAKEMVKKYRKAMIVLARNDPSWFCQYVLKNRDGGMIRQQPHHHAMHRLILENQRSLIWTFPEAGKLVPLNELLATPTGWVRMGDVEVGDTLYARNGKTTRVTGVSAVDPAPKSYLLTLDDGVVLKAGAEHQWLVHHTLDRHKHPRPLRVATTEEIAHSVDYGDRKTWAIPLVAPLEFPEAQLPIHPYTLGVWLGDGNKTGATITHHIDDSAIIERCCHLDGITAVSRLDRGRAHILRTALGDKAYRQRYARLGLLCRIPGKSNKHIPDVYKRASVEQRFELLAGLLDTDGCALKKPGAIELCFCNERLATDAIELIRSLGFKARIKSSDAKISGVVKGTRYRITFTAHVPVFRLQRKLDRQMAEQSTVGSKCQMRYIVSAELVDSEPMRCISVDSEDHSYVYGKHHTVTHNSSQIAIGHVLWRLGKDPNRSFGILSNAAQMASNLVGAMKCEVAGTKVLRSDGAWVNVESLVDWTSVKTFDPVSHRLIDVTARSAFNAWTQCIRVELANGHRLTVTEDHPLFVATKEGFEWRKAKEIKEGNKVLAIRDFDISDCTSDEEIPPEAAEVIGYLLGGRKLENTHSMVLRDMNRQPLWANRRQAYFERLGWKVRQYGKWSIRVDPDSSEIAPADYALQVIRYKDAWPVDLHPAVWSLSRESIKRLLCGFWTSGFLCPEKKSHKQHGFLSGTVGIGHNRVPKHIEHVNKATLDVIRRLFLRVGVRAVITKSKFKAKSDFGKIAKFRRVPTPLYRLSVEPADVGRFWPVSGTRYTEQSAHYLESVTRVKKLLNVFPTWAVEVKEHHHSYISGGVLSHNTYIAESPELHDVFPDLKPGDKWAANSFTVQRNTIRKDPSVTAIGLTGKFLGARFDGLVMDDVDSVETVLTEDARKLTERIVRTKALSRLSEDGWAVAIGNVWDKDDLMHRLEKTGWKAMRFPVMDKATGESNDPENFPIERIYAIRDEDQGPLEFSRLYMLEPRAEGEERFRMEWIEGALMKGKQSYLLKDGLAKVPSGCRTITGVDLGIKKKASSDPTAVVTILEIPITDKKVEYSLLNIETGRWNASEIMDKIQEQQRLFNSEVWVESNGAQDLLIQLMNLGGRTYKVNSFYTGRNKYDPMFGVESIAAELATGCWTLPAWEGTLDTAEPEVHRLCQEMHAYMPNAHTGDLLMALWIAREGARTSRKSSGKKVEFGRIRLRR